MAQDDEDDDFVPLPFSDEELIKEEYHGRYLVVDARYKGGMNVNGNIINKMFSSQIYHCQHRFLLSGWCILIRLEWSIFANTNNVSSSQQSVAHSNDHPLDMMPMVVFLCSLCFCSLIKFIACCPLPRDLWNLWMAKAAVLNIVRCHVNLWENLLVRSTHEQSECTSMKSNILVPCDKSRIFW